MQKILKTFTFNTGRGYTPDGQVINVICFEQEVDPDFEEMAYSPVWIQDLARGITLYMEVWTENGVVPTEELVLSAYDTGGNTDISPVRFVEAWAQAATDTAAQEVA